MENEIETLINYIIKKVEGLPCDEQSFIYSELSGHLASLSHNALMAEYGLKEEEF